MAAAEMALKKVEDDLNCLVCLDTYTDPKLLQCHHIFCRECLGRLVRDLSITCPTCRKVTPVPAGGVADLQPAFHISHLLEILNEHKKCAKETCYCSEHPKRELESFCETCKKLICLECVLDQHKGHDCNLVTEKYKIDILSSLNPVQDNLKALRQGMDELQTRYREIFDQQGSLEAKICEHARQIQEAAEARKVELIKKLRHITGEKLQDLGSQFEVMEASFASLNSYFTVMHEILEKSSQELVVKRKTAFRERGKELTEPIPDSLVLDVDADVVFSIKLNLIKMCRSFGEVLIPGSPDPAQCQSTGKGLEVATVGEKSTVILQAIGYTSEPFFEPIPLLKCELVSELTGRTVRGNAQRRWQSEYEISYQPTIKGRHHLHIKISGQHIRGSPFSVAVKLPVEKLGTLMNTLKHALTGVVIPSEIAVSQSGDLVISDVKENSISVFSPRGTMSLSFGMHGSGEGQLDCPGGVAVDGKGNILVAEKNNHRIQQFTAEGQFLKTVGTKGKGPLQFLSPRGIAFNSSNGKIYIGDSNHRIQILNSDLTFSSTFGKRGKGYGQFKFPWSIACDSTGKVYVADGGNHRIQVFTAEGEFLRMFAKPGETREQTNQPYGIAVDITSNLVYVSQPRKNCISVFTCEGQFIKSFSTLLQDEQPNLFGPAGVAVNSQGLLYVCDMQSQRVSVF